jgi:two-component system CheB/CheR fusion protein
MKLDNEDISCFSGKTSDIVAELMPSAVDTAYVVGLGASAGGLEPLEKFFEAVPPDSGLSFVVIQHLSPDFKSMMDEILARITPMPIVRVMQPVDIAPNTIYIIPPRKEMVMRGRQLLTQDKPPEQQLNLPINAFFKSLAREQGARSIAIVLSGTGTDGSLGIKDVQEAGGLVLAQSVETAKFDGMPKSAVNTGCVDASVAPEDMPSILLQYIANPPEVLLGLRTGRRFGEPLTGVAAVLEKLRETYDLDFNFYKPGTIARRIDRRVSLGNTGVFQDYIDLVLRNNDELDRLYKDLLIGVTQFFRDTQAFEVLEQSVIPRILDAVDEKSEIKLWVPACATGEESYSLGILFLEACEQRGREANIKIFATDMHRDSLSRAAEGLFSEESLNAIITEHRRQRYFIKEPNGLYRVAPHLRKRMIFSQHNLLKDPPFTKVDLVSCRNLLIYFQPAAQHKVLAAFHFALKHKGFLFLGPSEGTGELAHEYDVVDRKWKIYSKSRNIRLPLDMRRDLRAPQGSAPLPPLGARNVRMQNVYDEIMNRYMPAAILINEHREIVHIYGDAARYVKPPVGQMSKDLVNLTQGDLKIALASVLQTAGKRKERVELKGVRYVDDGGETVVDIVVEPLTNKQRLSAFVMVLFEERALPAPLDVSTEPGFAVSDEARERILTLEQELLQNREALQSTIEELETSGEELQSANEELLASNEEMQSTNEELHSVNEELYSVNSEHELKIKELNELTTDWRNLMRSIDIGVVFLDNHYRIRLFSPKATEIFNLLPQDSGRDMRHLTSQIADDDISEALGRVIQSRTPEESRQTSADGKTYLRRILPYEGLDRIASGVVITLVDITDSAQIETALRESEAKFRSMIQALAEGIFLVSRSGVILSCNEAAARMCGVPAEAMIDGNLFQQSGFTLARDEASPTTMQRPSLEQTLKNCGSLRGMVLVLHRQPMEKLWLLANAEPILSPLKGHSSAILLSFTDITALKKAEEQLRIAAVALESLEGMMVTDDRGTILRVNRAFSEITGYAAEEATGQTPALLQSGKYEQDFYKEMWRQLLQEGSWKGEIWNKRKDGTIFPLWLTISAVRAVSGVTTHYVATFFDISERKQAEAKIREMAFYDPLTNLPNRRLLTDRLFQALVASSRTGQFGALLMLDLDNFKTINDVHGHAAGDRLLIEVAGRLLETVRESDTVSRLGGDEFVLILENFGPDELSAANFVEQTANKILAVLNEPYFIETGDASTSDPSMRFHTSASCGIAMFQTTEIATEDLMKRADVALYQAKDAGKNTSRFFSETTQAEVYRNAELMVELRAALEHGHFQLYFQPQLDDRKCIIAAEALIRWQHPDGVIVSPAHFIPFAEKSGLILPIGNWVLTEACKTLNIWSKSPVTSSLRLAVNLSARQFHQPDFYDSICALLDRYNVNPTLLELELTESIVIDNIGDAVAKMNSLKKLGLHLSLDDFGSGYSSLTYLKRLPFNHLKIDQSFVRDIMNDRDDAAIVRTIIAMGKALRLNVTAEGVETEEQYRYLHRRGCRMFQGYLFSKPLSLDKFFTLAESRQAGVSWPAFTVN